MYHSTPGPLQQQFPRERKEPLVNYEKGGSDFRTPVGISSFLKQASATIYLRKSLARLFASAHFFFAPQPSSKMLTEPRSKFATQNRWVSEAFRSPGPVYSGPSSIGKQLASRNASAGAVGFGTSTRDGALKTYANFTV